MSLSRNALLNTWDYLVKFAGATDIYDLSGLSDYYLALMIHLELLKNNCIGFSDLELKQYLK